MPYSYGSGDSPPASHTALTELGHVGGDYGGDAAAVSRMGAGGMGMGTGSSGSSERSSRRRSKRPSKSKSKSKKGRRQETPDDQI